MKKNILVFSLIFFIVSCSRYVEIDSVQLKVKLPMDDRIMTGVLENGLTYYLRKNQHPADEAVFRLVLKVGSVQETEQQLGAAHFVEHMAFNGTRHFEKNDLIEFFRDTGMGFGPDLNGHTGWEETVYKFRIPVDKPEIVDKAFLVLGDWIDGLTFNPLETEKERGVVIEEWRKSRGIYSRAYQKHYYPKLFSYSRHAGRYPIGDLSVLKNITVNELKQFYRDWYQPRHMALIIVGDINPAEMKSRITNAFSKIKNRKDAPQLVKYPIPDHREFLYTTISDPDTTGSFIQIIQKNKSRELKTELEFRDYLIERLYISILNTRIQVKEKKGSALAVGSVYVKSGQIRFLPHHTFLIRVKENRYKDGLQEAFVELEKIKRFGFHESELERAKKELRKNAKIYLREKDNTTNKELVPLLVDAVIRGDVIVSEDTHYNLVEKYLPNIRLEDLNQARSKYNINYNRMITIFGTEKAQDSFPTHADARSLQKEMKMIALEPSLDEVSDLPFFTGQIEPGKIVAEKKLAKIGVTVWELSNGITVVLKPTKFKEEEILVNGYSPGGYSMIPKEEYWSSSLSTQVFMRSGVGPFKRTDLIKRLIFKNVEINPYIGHYEEGVSGNASPEDLEILLQLIHLGVTQPRFDPEIFAESATNFTDHVKNNQDTANWKFSYELNKTVFPQSHWLIMPTLKDAEMLNMEASRKNLLVRLQNTGDFTFQFVGNFELDWIKPLVLKYVATLPAGKKEQIRDLNINSPKGQFKVVVNENLENKSELNIILHHDFPYSEQTLLELATLAQLINQKILREIREKQSLIYSGGTNFYIGIGPRPYSRFIFHTLCAPENVETVISEYKRILQELRSYSVDDAQLEGVKKNFQNKIKNKLVTNAYWARKLKLIMSQNGDPNQILESAHWVDQITPETVLESAEKYLKPDNFIIGILNPKNKGS
jgi:zinc protease